jgi:hypothetical protein
LTHFKYPGHDKTSKGMATCTQISIFKNT